MRRDERHRKLLDRMSKVTGKPVEHAFLAMRVPWTWFTGVSTTAIVSALNSLDDEMPFPGLVLLAVLSSLVVALAINPFISRIVALTETGVEEWRPRPIPFRPWRLVQRHPLEPPQVEATRPLSIRIRLGHRLWVARESENHLRRLIVAVPDPSPPSTP